MDMQLKGTKVLVTGGSRGIGLGIARAFAREGCELVLVSRSQDALDNAAAELGRLSHVPVTTVALSLSEQGAAAALAQRFPDVAVLVNNAGAIPPGNLQQVGEAAWRESWELKVFGYIALTRAYMPLMREHGGGVVVNIIGAAGEMLDPEYIAGSVGNAALMAFTRALGSTSLDQKIRVVGINPGPVGTQRHESLLRRRAEERLGDAERWSELVASLPHGRAASVDEIAAMAVMLASPLSAYTSGSIVNIDGGLSLRRRTAG